MLTKEKRHQSKKLREMFQERLRRPTENRIYPKPRYDDVYFRGLQWLSESSERGDHG